jgi:acetolactate synthase-1/2/3 large subunit
MKLSDYITDFLAGQGVTHVFGFAGGAVTHMLDSLHGRRDIRFVSAYHEQAAAFAAEGYARMKNDIGVALATSGPGATNLITGIGSAYFDSVPCLYITGQVNTYEYKGDMKIRQLGFQETDIVSIVKSITKYAVRVSDPHKIKYELQKSIALARGGRKGPVLLDIPMDVQRADISPEELEGYEAEASAGAADDFRLADISALLGASRRPVILAGGGVRQAGASELLGTVARRTKIPVVCSLMGLDACDQTSGQFCGMIGAYGNRYANFILANSDLIISLGSRLDTRQTGTRPASFAREARLVRVDIDENELERKIKEDELPVRADVSDFLKALEKGLNRMALPDIRPWLAQVGSYIDRYPSFPGGKSMHPNSVMHEISRLTGENDILCLDVGQNQMWAAQSLRLKSGQRLLISGGMGAMGFSLPAAVGAHYACPGRRVLSFCGDGGMQMNVQELQLLRRNNIPVKLIILNNRCLGMIRHFQEMYFEGRYEGTIQGYSAPDFCRIAEAYGIRNARIESPEELKETRPLLEADGPVLIEILLDQTTYVYPKLAVNRPLEDQEPLLDRDEFLRNMLVKPAREEDSV